MIPFKFCNLDGLLQHRYNIYKKKASFFCEIFVFTRFLPKTQWCLKDIIPDFSFKYEDNGLFKYYVDTIKNWRVDIMDFNTPSFKPITTNYINHFPQIKIEENINLYLNSGKFVNLLYYITKSETYASSESEVLSYVRAILLSFENHLQAIDFTYRRSCFLDSIIKINNTIKLLKGAKVEIIPDKKLSTEDNVLLSVYFVLLKNYITFAMSLIDVYNIYLKDEKTDILHYDD
ncbi:hypothetical protein CDIK_1643 [Cucumispora dikerogammari]|nr:hypothetical protein CDIK_1643 [Cucumispora dikerogammari]